MPNGRLVGCRKTKPPTTQKSVLSSELFARPVDTTLVPTAQDEHRQKVSKELLSTEQSYVEALALLCHGFLEPLRSRRADFGLTLEELGLIFSNAEVLLEFHSELLRRLYDADLVNSASYPKEDMPVGPIFIQMEPMFKAYETYIGAHAASQEMLARALKRAPELATYLLELRDETGKNLDLQNFISWPIQRIPRYLLLLKELMKTIPTASDSWQSIVTALDTIERVADAINKARTQAEQLDMLADIEKRVAKCQHLNLVQPHRRVIREGSLLKLWETRGLSSASSSSTTTTTSSATTNEPVKAVRATFWLFNDIIMWAVDNVFEGFWSLDNAVVVPPRADEDACTFTFAVRVFKSATEQDLPDQIDPSKTWALSSDSPSDAASWMKDIDDAIGYMASIPQHVRESLKCTWKNDSLESAARVQGFLSLKNLKWRRFYCRLQGSTLYWFSDPSQTIPRGSQSCLGFILTDWSEDKKRPYSLCLSSPGKTKTKFVVQADALMYSVWLTQLKGACATEN